MIAFVSSPLYSPFGRLYVRSGFVRSTLPPVPGCMSLPSGVGLGVSAGAGAGAFTEDFAFAFADALLLSAIFSPVAGGLRVVPVPPPFSFDEDHLEQALVLLVPFPRGGGETRH